MAKSSPHLTRITRIAGLTLLAALMTIIVKPTNKSERSLASVSGDDRKWQVLKPAHTDQWHLGKGQSSLLVEISIDDKNTQQVRAGQPFTLHGHIQVHHPYSLLQWDWILPPGIHVVTGSLHNEKNHVSAPLETEITLISDRSENQQIHLHAYQVTNNERVGNVVQFNTQVQTTSQGQMSEATIIPKAANLIQ
jgi:hypothetical protein